MWASAESNDLTNCWLEAGNGVSVRLIKLPDLGYETIDQGTIDGAGTIDFALYGGDTLVDDLGAGPHLWASG